jgi:hypothetical protein
MQYYDGNDSGPAKVDPREEVWVKKFEVEKPFEKIDMTCRHRCHALRTPIRRQPSSRLVNLHLTGWHVLLAMIVTSNCPMRIA